MKTVRLIKTLIVFVRFILKEEIKKMMKLDLQIPKHKSCSCCLDIHLTTVQK